MLAGTHADVEVVNTRKLSIGVDDARALVSRAGRHPAGGRWQVMVVEDADRLTDQAGNALLKAIEEPTPRTVWLLCAPAVDDVLPTVRSRCRHLSLRTPPTAAVAEVLVRRDGVDPAMASFAARAAQGHIGRARRLATDEDARLRRHRGAPAAAVAGRAQRRAAGRRRPGRRRHRGGQRAGRDPRRRRGRRDAPRPRASGRAPGSRPVPPPQLKELESEQKKRATRTKRDALDRALVDLAGFYRDVLAVQAGAEVELVNDEMRDAVTGVARASTPESTLRRIDAILAARTAIDVNVAPLLAVEAMTVALRRG